MALELDIDLFSKNYLVRGLTPEQIHSLAELATVQKYVARDPIISAGSKGAELYVVLHGKVNVHMPDGDMLAEVGSGSVLGEMSLIDARPRSADAVCVGMVDVAMFDADALRKYLNAHRDIGFIVLINLAQVLCERLRSANEKIDFLAGGDVWRNAN